MIWVPDLIRRCVAKLGLWVANWYRACLLQLLGSNQNNCKGMSKLLPSEKSKNIYDVKSRGCSICSAIHYVPTPIGLNVIQS